MTNYFKPKFLFILSLSIYAGIGFGQGSNDIKSIELKKNVLYGTFGVEYFEFYGTLMGNYERMIVELPPSFFFHSFWFRIGAGPWRGGFDYPERGWNFTSTLSTLIGRKSSHMEIGGGVLYTYNLYYKKFQPLIRDRHLAGNLGFRYQKPGGNFLFRTGIGWPEFTYLSFGICF
jgi:hypothetical protein